MPHKRAKRPAREREKARRATDLAPMISIEQERIPKSVSRVLDARRIRREYRRKKHQLDGVGDSDDNPQRKKRRHEATNMKYSETTALKINPGETVPQFNRRVESTMVPLIRTALRQSSAQARRVRKEEAQDVLKQGKQRDKARQPQPGSSKRGPDPAPPSAADVENVDHRRGIVKEFQAVSTSTPRRLNDIAQEPPVIERLPRGAAKNDAGLSGVLTMAQRALMEEERDKAIKHYRELKTRKLREIDGVRFVG